MRKAELPIFDKTDLNLLVIEGKERILDSNWNLVEEGMKVHEAMILSNLGCLKKVLA